MCGLSLSTAALIAPTRWPLLLTLRITPKRYDLFTVRWSLAPLSAACDAFFSPNVGQ